MARTLRSLERSLHTQRSSGNSQHFCSDIAPELANSLNEIMSLEKTGTTLKYKMISSEVVAHLLRNGMFYKRRAELYGDAMYYDNRDHILYNINDDAFSSWLSKLTGASRAEASFEYIKTEVGTQALDSGTQVVEPQAYWFVPSDGRATYITYQPGTMVRISASGIDIVNNGTDGILFPRDSYLEPWSITDDEFDPLNLATFNGGNFKHPWAKTIIKTWLLCLFCMPYQMNRPTLVASGEQGAGKTTLFKTLGQVLGIADVAPTAILSGDAGLRTFWIVVDVGGIAVFDNVDVNIDWLENNLQIAATGGSFTCRRLYTDHELQRLTGRAWIGMTTSRPNFASNPAVADRLLVVELVRRADGVVSKDSELTEENKRHRNAILSWICRRVQEYYCTPRQRCDIIKRSPDFSGVAMTIAKALRCESEFRNAILSAEANKRHFNLCNNPLGYALMNMASTLFSVRPFNGSAADLLLELQMADNNTFKFWTIRRLEAEINRVFYNLKSYVECERTTIAGATTYKVGGLRESINDEPEYDDLTNQRLDDVVYVRKESISNDD